MTEHYLLPVGKKESIPKISKLQDVEHWVSKTAVMLKNTPLTYQRIYRALLVLRPFKTFF